jgi:uncharacterized protein YjbJ (UPF0337 family)
MGGDLEEGAGKILGDEKLKHEGQADQAEGKLQNACDSATDESPRDRGRQGIGAP